MKYMGSKRAIANEILPIVLAGRKQGQWYVEPFVGGCNTIQRVDGLRLGTDNNPYLIAMYKAVLAGRELPRIIPRELYNEYRSRYNAGDRTDDALIGWIGYMASANGRFYEGGYSGQSATKIGTFRDYISESIRGIEKEKEHIRGVCFAHCDYRELVIPDQSIVYCDPPYHNKKEYSTSRNFDFGDFCGWCRSLAGLGHTVYISEESMPDEFDCIWAGSLSSSLRANEVIAGSQKRVEKLYTYTGF